MDEMGRVSWWEVKSGLLARESIERQLKILRKPAVVYQWANNGREAICRFVVCQGTSFTVAFHGAGHNRELIFLCATQVERRTSGVITIAAFPCKRTCSTALEIDCFQGALALLRLPGDRQRYPLVDEFNNQASIAPKCCSFPFHMWKASFQCP
ncbi:hypothetical protein Ancab_019145 [Ancistrocladus abbreviatus]